MEEFLNIFAGTWLYSRDENLKKSMEDMNVPEDDIKFLLETKPTMTIERKGGKIFHRTELMPGVNHDAEYELGKEFVQKDEKSDPPLFHNKVMPTFDGAKVKFESVSLLTGPRKIDTVTVVYVKDGELITESSPPNDPSIVGKRIYKKKQ